MKIIKNQDIDNTLKDQKRVYLVGDIKMPNGLEAIKTDGYEIGISDYKEDTFDAPHVHLSNDEYNYVLEGSVKIFLFKENSRQSNGEQNNKSGISKQHFLPLSFLQNNYSIN